MVVVKPRIWAIRRRGIPGIATRCAVRRRGRWPRDHAKSGAPVDLAWRRMPVERNAGTQAAAAWRPTRFAIQSRAEPLSLAAGATAIEPSRHNGSSGARESNPISRTRPCVAPRRRSSAPMRDWLQGGASMRAPAPARTQHSCTKLPSAPPTPPKDPAHLEEYESSGRSESATSPRATSATASSVVDEACYPTVDCRTSRTVARAPGDAVQTVSGVREPLTP